MPGYAGRWLLYPPPHPPAARSEECTCAYNASPVRRRVKQNSGCPEFLQKRNKVISCVSSAGARAFDVPQRRRIIHFILKFLRIVYINCDATSTINISPSSRAAVFPSYIYTHISALMYLIISSLSVYLKKKTNDVFMCILRCRQLPAPQREEQDCDEAATAEGRRPRLQKGQLSRTHSQSQS